jgi:endonuclease YncB( thermonuclease family)
MKKVILIAALLALGNVAEACEVITGTVTKVADGDTFTLKTKTKTVQVRLAQIDAPEIAHFGKPAQPFGKDAADALREMIKGEKVSVEVQSVDQYGRTVGNVKMGKDNINAIMVQDGLAWVYREYVTDTGLIELENVAKEKGAGLWADANPIYPADFRKANK